jgi:hypothetical protein
MVLSDLLAPIRALLAIALQSVAIYIQKAITLPVAVIPREVVHQRPNVVAIEIDALK